MDRAKEKARDNNKMTPEYIRQLSKGKIKKELTYALVPGEGIFISGEDTPYSLPKYIRLKLKVKAVLIRYPKIFRMAHRLYRVQKIFFYKSSIFINRAMAIFRKNKFINKMGRYLNNLIRFPNKIANIIELQRDVILKLEIAEAVNDDIQKQQKVIESRLKAIETVTTNAMQIIQQQNHILSSLKAVLANQTNAEELKNTLEQLENTVERSTIQRAEIEIKNIFSADSPLTKGTR